MRRNAHRRPCRALSRRSATPPRTRKRTACRTAAPASRTRCRRAREPGPSPTRRRRKTARAGRAGRWTSTSPPARRRASPASSSSLKVIISGGFSAAYEALLPQFERERGVKVETGSGASQGSGPQTIAAQLARGVSADVVILSREGLTDLMAANHIAPGSDVDLAQVPIGVAVRAGAKKPDVSTVEAFKRIVTTAKTVAVPASTSGIFLVKKVFPRLGIQDQVNVKMTPRGIGAAELVATGEAEIGLLPVSEILHAPGVEHAGTIHPDIQLIQIFSAAVVAGCKVPDAAKALIDFLASDRAGAVIRKSGMEPLARG